MKEIKRETLSEQIAERLKEYIFEKGLKPGDRLPTETELMKIFGVSRSSVREAIKALQLRGLIDVKPRKGAVISNFDLSVVFDSVMYDLSIRSDEEIFLEILEARKALETAILPVVVEKIDEEYLDKLENWLNKMSNATSADEHRVYDMLFHQTLIEATHNRFLIQMGVVIFKFFQKLYELFPHKSGIVSLNEHKAIYEAIKAGDVEELQKIIDVHLSRYYEEVRQTVNERKSL
ncbi:TPA: FadR family transcriptional regulator [bacterium]|jgi:DNA-binding FadR family transcriptional regulator|nr:FadR family transcriptional regulator [bacterium]HPO81512.1 FadR/GntR family transcriptional regulator [bacterium]